MKSLATKAFRTMGEDGLERQPGKLRAKENSDWSSLETEGRFMAASVNVWRREDWKTLLTMQGFFEG